MLHLSADDTVPGRSLRIGYLQVGPAAHGICRYGRLLAAEACRRADLSILREDLELDGDPARDRRRIADAASRLSTADVVHVQVSLWRAGSWGAGARAGHNLRTFRRGCRAPIVFTLHDVTVLLPFENEKPLAVLRRGVREVGKGLLRPLVHRLRGTPPPGASIPRWNLDGFQAWRLARWVIDVGSVTFVLTGTEERLLVSMGLSRGTTLIPHFVEEPPSPVPAARPSTPGRKTVIVAGFIFEAKGHQMMVEAMTMLPDVEVLFVGGPSVGAEASDSVAQLTRLARDLGVLDRLRFTGYLPEDAYQRYLMEADLAVCPFGPRKSASSSLSSLIAAGCPIVASDIPLIGEYNALVPGAIATFSPHTTGALAAAVRRRLARPRDEAAAGLAELRRRLSIRVVYDQHLVHYRQAARDARRRA